MVNISMSTFSLCLFMESVDCSLVKLTSPQKQNRVKVSIQRRLLVHSDLHIVDTPLEHERAHPYRMHLARHQWVPSGKSEHIIWEVTRGVDSLGPVQIRYALDRRGTEGWTQRAEQDVKHSKKSFIRWDLQIQVSALELSLCTLSTLSPAPPYTAPRTPSAHPRRRTGR